MEFCSRVLGCKISADKPSVDGFEVSNLIADNKMGFVCESFVRSPVNIKIEFPLPIDIANIILETQVRERKTTGFKVFTQINDHDTKKSCDTKNSNSSLSLSKHKNLKSGSSSKHTMNSSAPHSNSERSEEFCLGKWFSVSEKRVTLKNYNYKHWFSFPLPCENKKTDCCYIGALRNPNRMALNSASSLIITITNVCSTGPPVLQGIQVWGQPSITSSPSQRNNIVHLWDQKCRKQSLDKSNVPSMYNSKEQEEIKCESNQDKAESPELVIPDEFLDPLTCEIMKLPILLPSGNSIDSFSLEKFIAHEAIWGRSPADPFTGIPFKGGYKPEPNVHLKVRIDRFCLIEKNLLSSYISSRGHVVTDSHCQPLEKTTLPDLKRKELQGSSHNRKFKKITNIHSLDSICSSSNSQASSQQTRSSQSPKTTSNSQGSKNSPSTSDIGGSSNKERSGRHSLIQALGTALSSTSKTRSSVQVTVKGIAKNISDHSFSIDKTTTKFSSLPEEKQTGEEKYSLSGISLNPLQCHCGNRTGVFYSLKCTHSICSKCTKSGNNGCSLDTINCGECGEVSDKHQLQRIHPKSAFAL